MRLRPGALLLAALALSQAGNAAAADPQVAGLQVALAAKRFYAGAVDGVSGAATVSAVRSLQRRQGLAPTGVLTPATRAALGRLGRPLFGARAIRRGMVGWDVAVLQFLLAWQGFDVGTLDGRFGVLTETALVAYQRRARLVPDGIAGPATRARICPTPGCKSLPPPLVRRSGAWYRVQVGDTLTAIAARERTTVAALAAVNAIDPAGVLPVGARLRLPRLRLQAAWPDENVPADRVKKIVERLAARAGVDTRLALAVAWVESGYQANVRSSTGDWGPMQVSCVAWDFVESVVLGHAVPHTTTGNIRVGIAYLRHLLSDFRGDERLALAAYHQGPAGVRTRGVLPATERYVETVYAVRRRA